MLWDALVCRLRKLRRYRAYVDQEIRPLWLAVAASNEMCAALPERALFMIQMSNELKVPGSPGWLYFRKLVTDPAREFGIISTSGGTPYKLIEAIHQDAAAREIVNSQRMVAGRNTTSEETDLWGLTRTAAGSAVADALGDDFGLSLAVKPTCVVCGVTGLENPEYGDPDDGELTQIDIPLSEGVAFDDDYCIHLERTAIEALRGGLSRMREMVESADPPRRRPSTIRNALANLDLLIGWLVLKEQPSARTDRIRLRRLAHRLGLLTPGGLPRDDEGNEAA
jgi:hypothetical protein